ncbi:amidohydrolase family protein [Streptomyces virginiae]|uniref:amidohydrolase family protein n=1 Tax=Streptomyces virginiae TaxID=1961 RepID=UPI003865ACB9
MSRRFETSRPYRVSATATAPSNRTLTERRTGRIALGRRADLTVLADDPLTVPATELPHLPVLLTVVDGGVTHRDASL